MCNAGIIFMNKALKENVILLLFLFDLYSENFSIRNKPRNKPDFRLPFRRIPAKEMN
jgi:hypothetical protein